MKLKTGLDHTERIHVKDSRGLRFCGMGAFVGTGRAQRAHVYTAAMFPVLPDTHQKINAEKLARELEVDMCAVNSGRFWMMDEYEYTGSDVVDFDGVPMRWAGDMTGSEMLSEFENAYTPSLIYRNTEWIFHAGKPVYLLREPSGAVWVLQEMTPDIDPSLDPADLSGLGAKLKLPDGWKFETKILDKELSLNTAHAGGWAAIMRDELGSAYQGCGYGKDTSASYIP